MLHGLYRGAKPNKICFSAPSHWLSHQRYIYRLCIADRFSSEKLGTVCADEVLKPEVFKAIAETINDVSELLGAETDDITAKLQEIIGLIQDGVVSSLFHIYYC
jgi:hypothetical protein